MARDTGPCCRKCRRMGEKLFLKGDRCLSVKCAVDRRSTQRGGQYTRRRKVSERGLQLKEKQKARFTYGVLERQFRRHFDMAEKQPGVLGENLLRILERRLDNIVFRLGFAESRRQARQLVCHGHFEVNGRKTDIPSFLVKTGDAIRVRELRRKMEYFSGMVDVLRRKSPPTWLEVDAEGLSGRVVTMPERQDIDVRVEEQAIVDYYSR